MLRNAICCLLLSSAALAAEPIEIKLWPDGPPSAMPAKSEATIKDIQSRGGATPTRLTDITDPTITVYRPAQPNGTAVIVAPGGGFMFLSWASEGTQVCEWLNSLGVTAVLLKYRTPTKDDGDHPYQLPVQDGQRALGLVRHHADEWALDSSRIGIIGFSAGANLAGHVTWDRGERTYQPNPLYDDPRGPDFLVFVYGGGFLNKDDRTKFRDGFSIPADAAPTFFLVAHDDKSNPEEAARLFLEYKRQGLPAELHVFTKGGHGFGMRKDKHPINNWPARCAEWFQSMGWIAMP
jgi:acetyl esterase/lipase